MATTSPMSRFIQLSDLHLLADPLGELMGMNTQASLEAVLTKVKEFHPDFLVLTGDIAQDGSLAAYQRLAKMLATLSCPVYWLIGNHDEGDIASQGLIGANLQADKYISSQHWRLILVNSTAYGLDDGFIGHVDFAQLHKDLQRQPELPSLILLHHPPLPVGCYADAVRVINDSEFLAAIAPYPQLRGVLFGHIHQTFEQNINGVLFLGSPSTCVQFAPRLSKFAIDTECTPGFRWVELGENEFKTGVVRI